MCDMNPDTGSGSSALTDITARSSFHSGFFFFHFSELVSQYRGCLSVQMVKPSEVNLWLTCPALIYSYIHAYIYIYGVWRWAHLHYHQCINAWLACNAQKLLLNAAWKESASKNRMFCLFVPFPLWLLANASSYSRFSTNHNSLTLTFWSSSLPFSWKRQSSWYETPSLQGFCVTWAQAATWTCALSLRPEWSTCEPTTRPRRRAKGE